MKFSILRKSRNTISHNPPSPGFTKKAIGKSNRLKTKAVGLTRLDAVLASVRASENRCTENSTPMSAAAANERMRQTRKSSAVLILIILFVAALCFGALLIAAFEHIYDGKIYPGVYLGSRALSGATRDEALKQIRSFQTRLEAQGVAFTYKNKTVPMYPVVVAPGDLDLTYELFSLDQNETLKNLFTLGRRGSLAENLKAQFALLHKPVSVPLSARVNDDTLLRALKENFKNLEIPAKNAELKITSNLAVAIIPEEKGIVPDYDTGIAALHRRIENVSSDPIVLTAKTDIPKIFAHDLDLKKTELEALFAIKNALLLSYNDEKWSIDKSVYKEWITMRDNRLAFTDGFGEYIAKKIAPALEHEPEEARFQLTLSGRVDEFKPSGEGVRIDYEKTLASVNALFFNISDRSDEIIPIQTNIIPPHYTTESINNLGIKELLGVGVSHFAGSPKNRRHNIAVGADAVNGILIPPGEEFSLVKVLGEIDGEHGYLPELVIKGDRTIPEYGGGLCQIGTTVFRGALASGLPITERRSHSYRVIYYEPAGTDCTIYPKHPDCRFVNDTGNHILIQTRIEKDDLYFEFWGTKDRRIISQTEPKIYNITKPPSAKYIETADLKQGTTKCTERAHNGAETDFDYTVTYSDGTVKKQTFHSYYKPWQAVCLVGKKTDASDAQTKETSQMQTQMPTNASLLIP